MKFGKLGGESFYLTEYVLFAAQPNTCGHMQGQAKGLTVYIGCGSPELQKGGIEKAQFQVEFAALIQSLTDELLRSSPPRPPARGGRGSVALRRLEQRQGYCTPLRCAHRPKDVPGVLRSTAPRITQEPLYTCGVLDSALYWTIALDLVS